ncbi:hypothetical protein [Massilia sp. DJPM01]|uniref:hypothetical protein n=1 Tax=Massilia sp. DJPM01 TaxID=3024404 RepID=UPI002805A753|nr:hypothetical protein [Massilia sp. DJPM01]
MPESTRKILTNKDVIAINQDKLGVQAWKFMSEGTLELWAKPLADNGWALMILNRGAGAVNYKLDWKKHTIGDDLSKRELDTGKTAYRWTDAWSGKTGDTAKSLDLNIASHSVAMLHLKAK